MTTKNLSKRIKRKSFRPFTLATKAGKRFDMNDEFSIGLSKCKKGVRVGIMPGNGAIWIFKTRRSRLKLGPMESSLPAGQKIPTRHHPEGIDPDQMFFQEARVHELILSYQRNGDPQTWQAIVMECLPLIDSLIRKHHFQLYEDQDALRSECVIKLSKAIRHYNPERGRAFSCLTVALTRFLFSYVTTIRTRVKRMSAVPDEVLEQYESNGQGRTELPEELKAKIQSVRTRFKTEPERGALKLLVNYFLLEGFSQPRKFVLDTLGRQFELSLEKAASLYDYALVSLRSVLHEYYTPGLLAPSLCLPR